MQAKDSDRRREPRFPIEAGATVKVNKNGRIAPATTVDMSGCGVLLQFEGPVPLALGDHVICEFNVSHPPNKPLPYWGVGSVVRVDGSRAAIDLKGACLSPLEGETENMAACESESREQ